MSRVTAVARSLFNQAAEMHERALRMYATSKIEGIPPNDKNHLQVCALRIELYSKVCYKDANFAMHQPKTSGYRIVK